MDRVEKLLRLLEDGKWAYVPSLAEALHWRLEETLQVVQFLSEHGLLNYRARDHCVRVDPELRRLMREAP